MVEFYLLTFPRFPLRKKEHKSYFGKNRTHDFRTSRCAAYLLDHTLYIIVPPAPAPAIPLRLLGVEHMLQVAGEELGEYFVGIERVRPLVLPV